MRRLIFVMLIVGGMLIAPKKAEAAGISVSYYTEGTFAFGFMPAHFVEIEGRLMGHGYNPFNSPDFGLVANWMVVQGGAANFSIGTGYDFNREKIMVPFRLTTAPFQSVPNIELGIEILTRIGSGTELVPQGAIRVRF